MDELLDDLFRSNTVVERDAQLTAQRLERAEFGRDSHRHERSGPYIQDVGPWPGVTEGMHRCQPGEVPGVGGLAGAELEEGLEPAAEQFRGSLQRGSVGAVAEVFTA